MNFGLQRHKVVNKRVIYRLQCQVGKLFIVETNELISCSTGLVEAEMSDRKCKSTRARVSRTFANDR